MPAFTPIDLIASLAALNRGDIEGFRQPYSREGRQQTMDERSLRTQDIALRRQIAQYFAGLQPGELPPAQAQQMTAEQLKEARTRQPYIAPGLEAGIAATRAGTEQTQAQTRQLNELFRFLAPQAQAGLESTQAGTGQTQAQTEGLRAVLPTLRPAAEANVAATQAGTAQTQAQTRQMDELFKFLSPQARAALMASMAGTQRQQAETDILQDQLGQRESATKIKALVDLLGSTGFGFNAPGQAQPALQKLNELLGTQFGTAQPTATNDMAKTFEGWMQQLQQPKSKGTKEKKPPTLNRIGAAATQVPPVDWYNRNVQQPLMQGGRSIMDILMAPNRAVRGVFDDSTTQAAPPSAPQPLPDSGQLQQVLDILKRTLRVIPGALQQPAAATPVPGAPIPFEGPPPLDFYQLMEILKQRNQ